MGMFIIAGRNAENYPTRLKELERSVAIVETMLVLPGLIRLGRMIYWKRKKKQLLDAGMEVDKVKSLDFRDLIERAAWTAAQSFAAWLAATRDLQDWRSAVVAAVAAGLSVLKNTIKQARENRVADSS